MRSQLQVKSKPQLTVGQRPHSVSVRNVANSSNSHSLNNTHSGSIDEDLDTNEDLKSNFSQSFDKPNHRQSWRAQFYALLIPQEMTAQGPRSIEDQSQEKSTLVKNESHDSDVDLLD